MKALVIVALLWTGVFGVAACAPDPTAEMGRSFKIEAGRKVK